MKISFFDTNVYEVKYIYRHKASLSENNIAENIYLRVNKYGNIFVIFHEIVYHNVDWKETNHKDALIISKNVCNRRRDTTKLWRIMIQWKYGSTSWEIMKDVR